MKKRHMILFAFWMTFCITAVPPFIKEVAKREHKRKEAVARYNCEQFRSVMVEHYGYDPCTRFD